MDCNLQLWKIRFWGCPGKMVRLLQILHMCICIGKYMPYFSINKWKYLDFTVVNVYAFRSILFYSSHFEKLECIIDFLGLNFILLVHSQNYAFYLTKGRLKPNFLTCSLFYFYLSLFSFSFKDSSALFAVLLIAGFFSVYYQCVVLIFLKLDILAFFRTTTNHFLSSVDCCTTLHMSIYKEYCKCLYIRSGQSNYTVMSL